MLKPVLFEAKLQNKYLQVHLCNAHFYVYTSGFVAYCEFYRSWATICLKFSISLLLVPLECLVQASLKLARSGCFKMETSAEHKYHVMLKKNNTYYWQTTI